MAATASCASGASRRPSPPERPPRILVISSASGTVIGGPTEGERNVISVNALSGIVLSIATSGSRVQGNYIGTDATGTADLGNGSDGIFVLEGASANVIGTHGDGRDDASEGNVISGNGLVGVRIRSSYNVVAGNLIGTDKDGLAPIANAVGVVAELGAAYNRFGTDGNRVSDAQERNVVSGNAQNGFQIQSSGTTGNRIAGNYIGTDADGTAALGNAGWAFPSDQGLPATSSAPMGTAAMLARKQT